MEVANNGTEYYNICQNKRFLKETKGLGKEIILFLSFSKSSFALCIARALDAFSVGLPVLIIKHRFFTNQNVRAISVYLPGRGWIVAIGAVIGWNVCAGDEVSVGFIAEKSR